ncbi:guanine nucleotide exchange factor synembryn-domain-containing protein [Mycena vulgaris]|nr:guanine nucleotide exchange factor synembryn-domain-containing protein [Mycena vulgaris]
MGGRDRAVKTLGRDETGSEVLGAAPNLSTLLGLVASLKDNPEASDEALRCIANALLLIERTRPVFISKEVNGGETGPRTRIGFSSFRVSCSSWQSTRPRSLLLPRALPPISPAPVATPLTHVIHSLIVIRVSPALRHDWVSSEASLRLGGSSSPPAVADTLLRAHSLLELVFSHYFPGAVDPDDASVRELAKAEAGPRAASESLDDECSPLDDTLSPLVALITRFCIADEVSRTRTRDWLCPAGLERRADLLGRCLRLLGSVYHVRLKDSVGDMLFAMCDSDAATLSTLFGYGNVAGFLFHKGIVNAPPPPAASASTSAAMSAAAAANINPITGTAQEARAPAPEMTDEEKERELERLFVLFDRLERTGALPANQKGDRESCDLRLGAGVRR